jgi:CBS domain-containing protein
MVSQVKHVMRTTINTIDANAKVIDATKIMGTSSYVIILEKGKPVGIITERDIIGKVLAQDLDPKCDERERHWQACCDAGRYCLRSYYKHDHFTSLSKLC